MTAFVAEHRDRYGIEPICKVLQIAPSTYYTHAARKADPERRPLRAWRDDALCVEVRRVFDDNRQVRVLGEIDRLILSIFDRLSKNSTC
jgi:putative transposase